jgi:lipoprotein-anchoring transpeptidase ErfK/SrfK
VAAAACAVAFSAHAGQDPLVIPGIGPGAAPSPQPVRLADAAPGAYGGGFIEFLMTRNPGTVRYNSPDQSAPVRVEPVYGAPPSAAYAHPHPAAVASLGAETHGEIDPQFHRQEVAYEGHERPGTIIIDTPNKFLFLVEGDGRALRYGIGVGRPGFEWAGVKSVTRKAEWPGWTPPAEMLLRRPDLPDHMDGGPGNPLGARALYLGSSLYRIHGTNEPWSIGKNVSSGCIRMMNQDVIDLYERVHIGAKVIVI